MSETSNPTVRIETSMGPIVLELDAANAPVTVANFLAYVDAGLYEVVVVEKLLRSRAAAEIEARRFVELGKRAGNVQSRPAFCLRTLQVQRGGVAARGGCGELIV